MRGLFTGKRHVAHPDWLDEGLRSITSTARLRHEKILPSVLEFPMVVTGVRHVLLACFGSNWAAVRFLAARAAHDSLEGLRGRLHRFWRYRIQMKSPEADWHDLVAQTCPRCKGRVEMKVLSEGVFQCPGCGGVCDEEDIVMGQPDEEPQN